MLNYSEALKRILSRVPAPTVHILPLEQALDHVLASAVTADLDLPPFDKSFMDGFAVRSRDTERAPVELEVVGTSAAGQMITTFLEKGQAIRIMTGAPIPKGADSVQMVEKTEPVETSRVLIKEKVLLGQHVAPRASEVTLGEIVLNIGRPITAATLAVLATFGQSEVEVFERPSATILATGGELVDINTCPAPGQIRNSNSHMLAAQCRRLGLMVQTGPPLADDPKEIRRAIRSSLQTNLTIFSGGVSMGDFDFVHQVLRAEGVDIAFHKAAVKPGKPLIVGTTRNRLIFGLPGNPVSSFVTFEVFVRPALLKWMGYRDHLPFVMIAELMEAVRHKPGRLFFKPAHTVSTPLGLQTRPVATQGSADIVAFSRANSLMLLGSDVSELAAGTTIEVLSLAGFPGIPALGFEI